MGELSIGEYQGKPQYDIRAHDIDWTPTSTGDGGNGGSKKFPRGTEGHLPGYDDDDGGIPFVTSAGMF
jgi:hypothetical protein